MKLKKIECGPECGFAIQSHDEKEVMDTAMNHVKKVHNMKVSSSDMKARMTTI